MHLQTVKRWWTSVQYLLRCSVGYANFCPIFFYSCCKNSTNSLLKLWCYWNYLLENETIFPTLLHDVETLVPLLMHAFTKRYCILFRNARSKNKGRQFRCLQKRPQIGYNSNIPIATAKLHVSLIIPIHMSANEEMLATISLILV